METPLKPRGTGAPANSQKVGNKSEQSTIRSVLEPTFNFEFLVILAGQRSTSGFCESAVELEETALPREPGRA